jgi:DNA recombination-dependent growth factor C
MGRSIMSSSSEKDPILPAAAVEETIDAKIERMAIKIAEEMAKEKFKKMMEENEKALEEKILSRLMDRMGMNKQDPPPSPTKASSSAK